MKKVGLVLICILLNICVIKVASQNRYLSVDKSGIRVDSIPGELVKLDLNGDTLGIVSVISTIDNLAFEGNIMNEISKINHENQYNYIVNVTIGSRNIRVKHDDYIYATITFPTPMTSNFFHGIVVDGVSTESGIVEGNDEVFMHPVKIIKDDFSTIKVDNQIISGNRLELEEGRHYITAEYGDFERVIKADVDKDDQEIDALISGGLTLTGAKNIEIKPLNGAPYPVETSVEGSTHTFAHMLGEYDIKANGSYEVLNNRVSKHISIKPKGESIYRINEMTRYGFVSYTGTPKQYLGISVGGCRRFGWAVTYRTNIVSKVDTEYGRVELTEADDKEGVKKSSRSTCWMLTTGPMFRLYRKLYLQVGGGVSRYLQTKEPEILSYDYKYKTGCAVESVLYIRAKALLVGAGYGRQFTKRAFTTGLNNQVIGIGG